MVSKKQVFVSIVIVSLFIAAGILTKKPSPTGLAVGEDEYSDTADIIVSENKNITWKPQDKGELSSFKISGNVKGNGTAKVYLEKDNKKYLVFDKDKPLFDVNIQVLPGYKKIFQGDKILIQVILFNLKGFGSVDVNVQYAVRDFNENVIAVEQEAVTVETQAKFVRELLIPHDLKPSSYIAHVEARSNGALIGTSSDVFEVLAKYEAVYPPQIVSMVAAIATVFVIAIVFSLGVYVLRRRSRKKKIRKLREQIPEERIRKLETELKALQDARKAKFISERSFQNEKTRIIAETAKIKQKLAEVEQNIKEMQRKSKKFAKKQRKEEEKKELQRLKELKRKKEEKEKELKRKAKGPGLFQRIGLAKTEEEKKELERQKAGEQKQREAEEKERIEREEQAGKQREKEEQAKRRQEEKRKKEEEKKRAKEGRKKKSEVEKKPEIRGVEKEPKEEKPKRSMAFGFFHKLGLAKTEEEKKGLERQKAGEQKQREAEEKERIEREEQAGKQREKEEQAKRRQEEKRKKEEEKKRAKEEKPKEEKPKIPEKKEEKPRKGLFGLFKKKEEKKEEKKSHNLEEDLKSIIDTFEKRKSEMEKIEREIEGMEKK